MNWRTTTLGAATILAAVATAVAALLDNDPLTNPNWALVAASFTSGLGLIMAKDASK